MSTETETKASPTTAEKAEEGYVVPEAASEPAATVPTEDAKLVDTTAATTSSTKAETPVITPEVTAPVVTAEPTPKDLAAPLAAPTAPPVPSPEVLDPEINELYAMFPDIPPEILGEVLAGHKGDKEKAINTLLSMSDPNFKPSQQETDEIYARSLAQAEGSQYSQLSYQPRVRGRRTQAPEPEDSRDELDKLADQLDKFAAQGKEQFGKFAEEGKKTFNFLFNKVKEAAKEFDKPREPIPVEQTGGVPPAQLLGSRIPYSRPADTPPPLTSVHASAPSVRAAPVADSPQFDTSKPVVEPTNKSVVIKEKNRRDSSDDEEFQRNPFDDYDD